MAVERLGQTFSLTASTASCSSPLHERFGGRVVALAEIGIGSLALGRELPGFRGYADRVGYRFAPRPW